MRLVLGDSGPAISNDTKAELNLIVGLMLLSFGLRNLLGARDPLEHAAAGDQQQPAVAPHWMRALDALNAIKAFGVGAVLLAVSPADLMV
jgi:hypothetical protein